MKCFFTIFFALTVFASFGQSKSFQTLVAKFDDSENVTTIGIGSFLLKTTLWLAGEPDMREEFGMVRNVRFINIPRKEFTSRNLKLNGFRKFLVNDRFGEVTSARDNGEQITVYMRDHGDNRNLYFILIEKDKEITAIEIKGKLDPKKLIEDHHKRKHTSL